MVEEPTDDVEPTELRYVGPATAAVIEEADFEASDIPARTVSYADLLAAGVNPGVAANLRREYSLVWSLQWVAGANLSRRAVAVGGLDPEQREWIASSPTEPEAASAIVSASERAWQERTDWLDADSTDPEVCERCGNALVTYELGDRRTVHCESCGYADVAVRS